ncbi:hypothetical protein RchiOBHm_Chr7g0231431 [Rosa chinensis]|uniref:Uncharacterized protein n=1 Tax=Rosa chinensis TaxID=74649 RepID=A0A2P6PFN8_ROSCH|nr:hypothetical protein RchiOBHm_Chr7g0231431 [Rosa chinensis]
MSSDFKLEGVKGHEIEDPEVGSPNGIHNILAGRRTMTFSDSAFQVGSYLHRKASMAAYVGAESWWRKFWSSFKVMTA